MPAPSSRTAGRLRCASPSRGFSAGRTVRSGGQPRSPRDDLVQVLRPQAGLRIGLDQEGYWAAGSAFYRPFVVEGGEVVVDPDDGGVAEPGFDVVTLPQVAVGVAGGELRAREVDVGQGRQAEERPDQGSGVLA